MNELAYNLESFNPAFTAVLLRVQCSIGRSDYVRRDQALKGLIQPLAGEYGMHNGEEQGGGGAGRAVGRVVGRVVGRACCWRRGCRRCCRLRLACWQLPPGHVEA